MLQGCCCCAQLLMLCLRSKYTERSMVKGEASDVYKSCLERCSRQAVEQRV